MAPEPQQIVVALDALESDAVGWLRIADELRAAAGNAGALTLGAPEFSFAGGALAASYEALRARLVALLDGGSANAAAVAAALRASAATYAAEEQAGVHRMREVY